MTEPINAFIIYAREDNEIKQRLLAHLNPLKNPHNLIIWHDDFIEAGQEWKPRIQSRLGQTDLFLLLVSVDFMNSEFINQVEFKYAIDRHKANKSVVIPVIINYCQWDIDISLEDYTFNLKELQVLPDGAKPVGDWRTPDQAFNNIAGGIKKVLITIRDNRELRRLKALNMQGEKATKETEEKIQIQNNENENPGDKLGLTRESGEKEEEEEVGMLPGENQLKLNNNGISKKIIFSLVVLFAAVISYFIFRTPHKSTVADPGKADSAYVKTDTALQGTLQDSNKNNVTDLSKNAKKRKSGAGPAVDPTRFTPPKIVKDEEVEKPLEGSNENLKLFVAGLGGTWTGGLWHIRSVVDRTDTSNLKFTIIESNEAYSGTWEGPINPGGHSNLSNFSFDGVRFYFIESGGACVSGKIQGNVMTGEVSCGLYNKPFARVRLSRN